MSAAQSQSTQEAKLKALQCHFTWDIDPNKSKLLSLVEKLEDIGNDDGNSWLGHIYNLQGYIHYQLELKKDALCFLKKATEAFRQSRNPVLDEGPCLVVNYGNLAWLYYHLKDQTQSETYLSNVDTLLKEHPSPSQDVLHPEIYAEKAWTLMKFGKDKKVLAADYFQRAIRMQPDIVEWHTSHVIGLVKAYKYSDKAVEGVITQQMRMAKEQDPENLYLAALDLEQRARKGEEIEDEARELARKVLENPVSSYSGIKVLLRVYKDQLSVDEAIALAEEALAKHRDQRFLKRCAALCYRWRIVFTHNSPIKQNTIHRAISLHKEVTSLYPHSALIKITLANIYAKSNQGLVKAEAIYQELLEKALEPVDKQMIYNYYAKYLNHALKEYNRSIEYHMKAAEIQQQSYYRENSIKILRNIKEKNRSRKCSDIEELLAKLEVQTS
ncbi:interferon-induced protein with tetratricopeptide repeats 5-like [Scomber japonicus]|uniref:interferon-induced protein with tetratricopeptide repeats 5-like n=1 Tax=Scomber japonicus TaxID=13676 RepID=UPI002306D174|nr:interferon-induced protein with tetratricopeptide repeats 5-like [Scomber japonicus]